jgi:hypothetical protein
MVKVMKEITGRETKSTPEEGGEHHNFFSARRRDLIPIGRPTLEHRTIWEKVIQNKLADLTLIHN